MADIVFDKVCLALQGREILRDFSLRLPLGETSCLLGPSGCGKTTLLRLLAGLQAPDSGTVTGAHGLRLSMVFQEDRLLPWRTLLQNVALVADETQARRRLAQLGLEGDLGKYPGELSGGMKRRAALARALAYGGDLLLLDEPTAGVDEAMAQRMLDTVAREYEGRTVLLVTHDRALAQAAGRVIELSGPPLARI